MAAIAEGNNAFECLVIATSTDDAFPFPDGRSREFLRGFGVFPVILVNSRLEARHSSTHELFPSPPSAMTMTVVHDTERSRITDHSTKRAHKHDDEDDIRDLDLRTWTVQRVKEWLVNSDFADLVDKFIHHKVDGMLLIEINEQFCVDVLNITNSLLRRKLVRRLDLLKKKCLETHREKTFDELDEYVMMLESHRIKLVAKLKAVFDRFDVSKEGRLTGAQIEQLLVYMNRPVDSAPVNLWLTRMKDASETVEFPEFVSKYSSFFSGVDPDVSAGYVLPFFVQKRLFKNSTSFFFFHLLS